MKTQNISSQALIALKDALAKVYWKKTELRQFIELTIDNSSIVSTINWKDNQKTESVSILIDRMVARKDIYLTDLLRLLKETSNFNDFSHLKYWDENGELTKRAVEAVAKLRNQTIGYFDALEDLARGEENRLNNLEKLKKTIDFSEKLEGLKKKFFEIAMEQSPQKRGYDFERILNELFNLFELKAKGPFKTLGEQIDGSFTFESQDFILEAKWQKQSVNAADLYVFGGKISGKLKNTLGLFISLDGFAKDCTETGSSILKSMILMDGQDLMLVLEGRISLGELIFQKRRHASDTGEIYHRIKL